MKALRYLLILVAMMGVLSVSAQGTAQFPNSDFRSTSVMIGSGSSLPQAAATGVTTTYSPSKVGSRKAGENPFDGGGTAGDVNNPLEPGTPIGDAWPLMLLAGAYFIMRVVRRRARA